MTGLPQLKPLKIAGKEVNAYLVVGIVVFIVFVGIALQFGLAPTKPIKSGLGKLNIEILSKIGVGLKVESKEEASQSIGSIAKELEKARGTLKSLNKNLEGGEADETPPSGYFGLTKGSSSLSAIVAALIVVAIAINLMFKRESNPLGFG